MCLITNRTKTKKTTKKPTGNTEKAKLTKGSLGKENEIPRKKTGIKKYTNDETLNFPKEQLAEKFQPQTKNSERDLRSCSSKALDVVSCRDEENSKPRTREQAKGQHVVNTAVIDVLEAKDTKGCNGSGSDVPVFRGRAAKQVALAKIRGS